MRSATSGMDDWLGGLHSLPGQDALEFAKNMPGKLLYQEGGKGLRGEWALKLHGAVDEFYRPQTKHMQAG